ncbi:MAG: type I-E CRISPR-associated protein Cse1/CasA [Thiohalocapsa sp.]|nr:type I-E CRISPR-associated protein Cse1/CasA [Thiohalocapsa sp.]
MDRIMPHNLLTSPWIPIRRLSPAKEQQNIAPWQITDAIDTNPIVALDAPRPDFNGALVQFLIGLLQTAFAPRDPDEWFERFATAPTPEVLQDAFSAYAHAFDLDGDGPRFMQDQDPLSGQAPLPITALLIDTAGSETHFVKDLPAQGMSLAAAAMALYTLQTNAPSGGVGHRTSLRGGGPLTTLVIATPEDERRPPTLWQTLWLNVLDEETLETLGFPTKPSDAARIFPWLAPTRTSEKGANPTTPEAAHPLQMFWGMPRRIRLDLDQSEPGGECAITGAHSCTLISRYRTKNYGINYTGAWSHTLSPYTHDGKDLIPMHPRGSINYRHWLSLMQETSDKKAKRLPAAVVKRFHAHRLNREGLRYRLWAFGYDMDNMKPRCWFESTLPLFSVYSDIHRTTLESAAEDMVNAAGLFLYNLRSAIKDAWFATNDPRHKSAKLEHVKDAFWQETEAVFYERINAIAGAADTTAASTAARHLWHRYLNEHTQKAYDRWVDYNQITEQSNPRRIAQARRALLRYNYSKKIKDLLEIPDRAISSPPAAA